jgi:hypothetical protein
MKHFDTVKSNKLREYQKKSVEKREENYVIKCDVAYYLYETYGEDIQTVMSVLSVGRTQAYQMVKRGRELQ